MRSAVQVVGLCLTESTPARDRRAKHRARRRVSRRKEASGRHLWHARSPSSRRPRKARSSHQHGPCLELGRDAGDCPVGCGAYAGFGRDGSVRLEHQRGGGNRVHPERVLAELDPGTSGGAVHSPRAALRRMYHGDRLPRRSPHSTSSLGYSRATSSGSITSNSIRCSPGHTLRLLSLPKTWTGFWRATTRRIDRVQYGPTSGTYVLGLRNILTVGVDELRALT